MPGLGRLEDAGRNLLVFFARGLTAHLHALSRPREFFKRLGDLGSRYGVFFTLPFSIGVWTGLAFTTAMIIAFAEAARSMLTGSLVGLVEAPFKALVYSLALPAVYAILDSSLIIISLKALGAPTRRPLHIVFAARASSGIPYTFKAGLHALTGDLSIISLIAYCGISHILLGLAGVALTVYGLENSLGASRGHALAASLVVYSYKVALCALA